MSTSETQQRTNPNSALYWLEATKQIADEYDDLNVPETEVVPFDFERAIAVVDGDDDALPLPDLEAAAERIGYPVFLRTDLASAKHAGIDGVRVDDPDEFTAVAARCLEACAAKFLRPTAFLVRDWIEVDHEFRAFGDLPVGVEFRVFATPDEEVCRHYYWPEASIRDASLPESLWQSSRDRLEYARQPPWLGAAARGCAFEADFQHGIDDPERAWSVDFARDEDGEWYCIDMALAAASWHPDDCDHLFDGGADNE